MGVEVLFQSCGGRGGGGEGVGTLLFVTRFV